MAGIPKHSGAIGTVPDSSRPLFSQQTTLITREMDGGTILKARGYIGPSNIDPAFFMQPIRSIR